MKRQEASDGQTVLFLFCFFNEVFFVCAYLNAFEKTPIHSSVLLKLLGQVVPFHTVASYLPGPIAMIFRYLGNISWAQFIGGLTLPICTGKQIINVVQFWKASKIVSYRQRTLMQADAKLVGVDLAERQAAREAKAIEQRGR
jgi:CDP-diacylglycerol--inositol 3-phosphatidyltransferase